MDAEKETTMNSCVVCHAPTDSEGHSEADFGGLPVRTCPQVPQTLGFIVSPDLVTPREIYVVPKEGQ
jgi:hypothetical protein